VRPPRAGEWPACRMLLPECFEKAAIAPEALIAWDEESRAIAGAAAFHRLPGETAGVQVITVKPYRRQRVGSMLLGRIVEWARERGDRRLSAWTDVLARPGSELFLEANGFVAGNWMLKLEGDLAPVRETILDWRRRLVSAGKAPSSATIVERHELDAVALQAWYEQTIVPELHGRPEFAGYIFSSPDLDATVLLVDGRPAGILAGVRNDGQGLATISAVAVAPEFQGGWGWANLLLLASGLDRACAAGAHGLRFETGETNWKVLQAAGRVRAVVMGRSARFTRTV
jgi:GNAT superfamily N-acetyltransferase/ribosomal protein S18 acetylase RimI-like enzyme